MQRKLSSQIIGIFGSRSGSVVKKKQKNKPVCQCRKHRRCRFDPWVGKIPGGGNGNPFQYSCLENSMDREPGGIQSMGLQRVGHN